MTLLHLSRDYCVFTVGWATAPGSFLFSLRNNDDLPPFKSPLKMRMHRSQFIVTVNMVRRLVAVKIYRYCQTIANRKQILVKPTNCHLITPILIQGVTPSSLGVMNSHLKKSKFYIYIYCSTFSRFTLSQTFLTVYI